MVIAIPDRRHYGPRRGAERAQHLPPRTLMMSSDQATEPALENGPEPGPGEPPETAPSHAAGAPPAGDAANGDVRQPGFPIVGIGASAGGLEALETFFDGMPADPGAAFVVVQHLAPEHPSILPELLAKHTKMPVRVAEDGAAIEVDSVHVIPPNATLGIKGGVLSVRTPIEPRRNPIDGFFRSLAEDQGENAVCIVLSGTGTDGSLGLEAVKEHGGMAMAQSPETARYDSMPRGAIALGLVDHVLPPEEMPAKLLEYTKYLLGVDARGARRDSRAEDQTAALQKICAHLQRRLGHDFSQYKPATLLRRIRRRMAVTQATDLAQYLERLREQPEEVDLLFRDLLIGVTRFFRDPEAFAVLAASVVPEICRSAGDGGQARVWVAGCASGEEAYSIAILFREHLAELDVAPQVKIFATDIDEHALETARQGRYPEGIAEHVSKERLERFFTRQGDFYQVDKHLREMCIFSTHNIISDPPFSRLDLVSCRNLLIYLENTVQRKLVPLFHYALRAGGHLFLGPSEGLGAFPELFRTLDKKNRLFRRNDAARPLAVAFSAVDRSRGSRPAEEPPGSPVARRDVIPKALDRLLLDGYAPAAVIINEQRDIVYTSGRTGKYLELPAGVTSVNIVEMARPTLRPALHTAIHKAFGSRQETVHEDVTVEVNGHVQRLDLTVRPMPDVDPAAGLFVVVFADIGPPISRDGSGAPGASIPAHDPLAQVLEAELRSTKEHLQSTIEALETSNEELKSANEEMLSTNEELQSTNEELQTSKEELQSINEELQTVNLELNRKVDELDRANSDLQNLLASTHIATIFLDRALRIKKFSAPATEVFRLIDSDVGRPITDIAATLADGDMVTDAREVLATLSPKERQVRRAPGDVWYIRRIRPYRTVDDVIDGVVITFVDITSMKQAQAHAARLAAIVESSQDAIIGMTPDGTITSWNSAAARLFEYGQSDVEGCSIALLSPGAPVLPLLEQVKAGGRVAPFDAVWLRKNGSPIDVQIALSPVAEAGGGVTGAALIAHDIGERKQREKERAQLVAALEEADRRKNEFLAVLGHELRNPLVPIRNAVELMRRIETPEIKRAVQMTDRQLRHITHLIDDLLDVTRIASGKIILRQGALDLGELVQAVVEDCQPSAAAAHVSLSSALPDGALPGFGDATRLSQAVSNLVLNALKFTGAAGRVTVTLEPGPGGDAVIRVGDSGVGMAPEAVSRMFEPFAQVDVGMARGGLGLGLPLARGLVELHGGTLEGHSEGIGRGATFTIHLPAPPAGPLAAPAPDGDMPAASHGGPLRILLVEDDPDVGESMCMLLELDGHAVMVAPDGRQAIDMARAAPPDVVLCDIGLPDGMDGHAVARALRADPATASAYLVALSGYGQEEDRRRSSEAGFERHLIKPLDPDVLARILATVRRRD